jgi:hypothetical protein
MREEEGPDDGVPPIRGERENGSGRSWAVRVGPDRLFRSDSFSFFSSFFFFFSIFFIILYLLHFNTIQVKPKCKVF